MTTGKTIVLTRQTLVSKVMSLLLNMPSSLVITFLPRSKHLLISWLQSPSAVILEPKKVKSDTPSTSPSQASAVRELWTSRCSSWLQKRQRNQRSNCQLLLDHRKSKRVPRVALLTMPKPLTVWITTNWKILKEMEIPDHLTCLLKNLSSGKEATVRTRHAQQTGSKLEKEYLKLYIVTLLI